MTLRTSRNPSLAEALQAVPEASKLAPTLQLKVLPAGQAGAHRSRGRYRRGTDRATQGQDQALLGLRRDDPARATEGRRLQTGTIKEFGDIFKGRRATQRGTHSAPGRPVWPNPDNRLVPEGASLMGAHAFSGQGVPESFKFNAAAGAGHHAADRAEASAADGVTQLTWQRCQRHAATSSRRWAARATVAAVAEMTTGTSSELPDSGFGLVDYQTNKSVDQWLKEKVLLQPTTASCDIPKDIFGEGRRGAMLRMIAYGTELNLALRRVRRIRSWRGSPIGR